MSLLRQKQVFDPFEDADATGAADSHVVASRKLSTKKLEFL